MATATLPQERLLGPPRHDSEVSLATMVDTPRAVPRSTVVELLDRLSQTFHGLTLRLALAGTLVLQAILVVGLHFIGRGRGLGHLYGHQGALALAGILQTAQVLLTGLSWFLVWRSVWRITMATACALYAMALLTFAGLYTLCVLVSNDSLSFAHELQRESDHDESAWRGLLTILYFSVEVQTLTGLGEIAAATIPTQVLSLMQMLAGVLFNTWILAQTMHRLTAAKTKGPRHGWLHFISRLHALKQLRKWTRQYLLAIVTVLQLSTFIAVGVYGAHVDLRSESLAESWVVGVGIVLTVLQIIVIMVTSSKFVMRKTHRVTMGFVFQAYFATLLTFAGLYTLLFLSSSRRRSFWVPLDAWDASGTNGHVDRTNVPVFPLIMELLMFSVSTLTSTGFGNIVPLTAAARTGVMVQMLLQVTFTVLILGYGLSHISKRRIARTASKILGGRPPLAPGSTTPVRGGDTPPLSTGDGYGSGYGSLGGGERKADASAQHQRRWARSLHKAGHIDDGRRYYHTSSSSSDSDDRALAVHAAMAPMGTPLLGGQASPVLTGVPPPLALDAPASLPVEVPGGRGRGTTGGGTSLPPLDPAWRGARVHRGLLVPDREGVPPLGTPHSPGSARTHSLNGEEEV